MFDILKSQFLQCASAFTSWEKSNPNIDTGKKILIAVYADYMSRDVYVVRHPRDVTSDA